MNQQLGRYILQKSLGHGAAGEVYLAVLHGPMGFRRTVALKVLFPVMGEAAKEFYDDLIKEARLGSVLKHPNIVETYELGEADGRLFIAMEYVDGVNLSELLKSHKKLSLKIAVQIIIDICLGLKYAYQFSLHGQPVQLVHCDLKPSNILLATVGNAKIADFGLAKAIGLSEQTDGGLKGTPAYMSPEQARGETFDFRSDIFSLGLILYELLTGVRVFEAQNPITSIVKIQQIETLLADGLLHPIAEISPAIADILHNVLRFSPDDRYSSYDLLLADLSEMKLPPGPDLVSLLQEESVSPTMIMYSSPHTSENDETKSQLPQEKTRLIGRIKEIEQIRFMLESGHRLVTVKGPGGVGKSRIIIRVAYLLSKMFSDIWFLHLHGHQSVESLCQNLAKQVGIRLPQQSAPELIEAVSQIISGQESCLIILDGFEGLAQKANEALQYWMQQSPSVAWLVTSRLKLSLADEKTIDIPPLSKTDAVRLLQIRLEERGQEIDNPKSLSGIVQLAEGNPLLLEIAAAQISKHSIDHCKAHFVEQNKRLALRGVSSAGRFTSLGETIAFSWSLLQPYERKALSQLSVFRGGFFMDAAHAVIDLSEEGEAPWAMDLISSLSDHSLIETEMVDQQPRFRLLNSIREFAERELKDAKEVELRHAQHYSRWGITAYAPQGRRLTELEIEEDNLQQAAVVSMKYKWSKLAAKNILGLLGCWQGFNLPYKGLQLLERVLSLADIPPRENSLLLLRYGDYLRRFGRYFESQKVLMESQLGFQTLDDELGLADVLTSLLLTYGDMGRYAEAFRCAHQALQMCLRKNDHLRKGIILKEQGYVLSQQGKMADASSVLIEASKVLRRHKAYVHIYEVMSNLGLIALRENDVTAAEQHYKQSLRIGKKAGMAQKQDMLWMNLGICFALQGKPLDTEHYFSHAAKRMLQIGAYRSLALLYSNWGLIRIFQRDVATASKHLSKAEKLYVQFPHPITEHTILHLKAELAIMLNQPQQALVSARESLQLVQHHQFEFKLIEALSLYSETLLRCGQKERAGKAIDELFGLVTNETGEFFRFLCHYSRALFLKHSNQHVRLIATQKEIDNLLRGNIGVRLDAQYLMWKFQELR